MRARLPDPERLREVDRGAAETGSVAGSVGPRRRRTKLRAVGSQRGLRGGVAAAGAGAGVGADRGPVRPLWAEAVRYALIFLVFVLLHAGWDYLSAAHHESSLRARRAALLKESCPPGVDCAQVLSDP